MSAVELGIGGLPFALREPEALLGADTRTPEEGNAAALTGARWGSQVGCDLGLEEPQGHVVGVGKVGGDAVPSTWV